MVRKQKKKKKKYSLLLRYSVFKRGSYCIFFFSVLILFLSNLFFQRLFLGDALKDARDNFRYENYYKKLHVSIFVLMHLRSSLPINFCFLSDFVHHSI